MQFPFDELSEDVRKCLFHLFGRTLFPGDDTAFASSIYAYSDKEIELRGLSSNPVVFQLFNSRYMSNLIAIMYSESTSKRSQNPY